MIVLGDMIVLGIETSCDETAAAVVAETGDPARPWDVRSNIVASQVDLHRQWGGVVPELASRQHVRDICGVVERALADAGVAPSDIGAVAVTHGPGLVGSLLVGLSFAKSLAASWNVPLVGVNHLAGHIESLFLEHGPLPLPAIVLVVSGGHTSLYLVPSVGEYRLIGRTRDDAAGEAYDKVAKLLGLSYPGGPVVDRMAKEGNDRAIVFPVARITHNHRNPPGGALPLGFRPGLEGRADFSFSGVKTAVVRYVKQRQLARAADSALNGAADQPLFDHQELADICASFQRAVVDALLDRTYEAAASHNVRSIGIAGGVSANSRLRSDAKARGESSGLPVFFPRFSLCTDNAAMIAAAGLRKLEAGQTSALDLNADAALAL